MNKWVMGSGEYEEWIVLVDDDGSIIEPVAHIHGTRMDAEKIVDADIHAAELDRLRAENERLLDIVQSYCDECYWCVGGVTCETCVKAKYALAASDGAGE